MKLLNDINDYDQIIVSYSGGKDSTAMVLKMLDQGVAPEKMVLWHQCIDGRGKQKKDFFDWPSTEGYVRQFAKTLGIRLGWQWRDRGFYKELYRDNEPTGDVYYEWEDEEGVHHLPSKPDSLGTRKRFPAKTANLMTRWCSSYLKIDPARRVINNVYPSNRKDPMKILFLTGERREESTARSKYDEVVEHGCHGKGRLVHQWRCVIDMEEKEVWDLMEKHSIKPHPAYYLGFPRLSCRSCIFFTNDHWATLSQVDPKVIDMIKSVEEDLDFTLDNKYSITEMVSMGKSRLSAANRKYVKLAVTDFTGSVKNRPGTKWHLPAGAFGEGGGSI